MQSFDDYVNEIVISLKKPDGYVDKTADFVDKFYALGTKTRNGVKIRANGTTVFVELVPFAGKVHVTEISIPNRDQGSGAGHTVMKKLTDMADKSGVVLDLFPSPIMQGPDETRIPKNKLVDFYKKHGFTGTGQKMIREPK